MKLLSRIFIIAPLLLSACVSVDGLITDMAKANDPEDIADYAETAIEIMQEKETDEPVNLAKLLEAGRVMSNRTNLSEVNSELFNRLVESYVVIAKQPPKAEDANEWSEAGLEIESTRDYLSSYAIHQLGLLEGPALGEQILQLVRTANSEGKSIAALHAMALHIDTYTVNNESRAQALAALAIAQRPTNQSSETFTRVFANVEELIVSQDAINTVLAKQDIYQLDDSSLDYVLNVNERLWNYYITSLNLPSTAKLQDNVRYMAVLALPKTKQLDGKIPNFTKTQKRAQKLLLAYAPGLYYFNMFENAKISDYSYGQLIAALPYMEVADNEAASAGKNLIATSSDKRKFFNHRALLNERVFTAVKGKAIDYVFKNLGKRADKNNPTYRNFIYSQLNELFPERFSDHLVKAMNEPYRNAKTDEQQAYYAANLVVSKRASQKAMPKLKESLYSMPLDRDLNYNFDDYEMVSSAIYPYLLDLDAKRFVVSADGRARNASRVQNSKVFSSYYITALNKQEAAEQKEFHTTLGVLLSRHSAGTSAQVAGYLKTRDVNEGIDLFDRYVIKGNKRATENDFVLLGNLTEGKYQQISAKNRSAIERMHTYGIKNLREDIALRASQESLAFFQGKDEAKKIISATKSRWPELNI